MEQNQIQKLVSFFFEIGTLRKIPRSHQQILLCQDLSDNVASHSFRVALIGYFLAKNLNADANKVMKMCFLHDLEEARTGDQNWIYRKYIKSFENEVRKEQLEGIDIAEELKNLSKEFDERKSPESKIAKDADILAQILSLREYEWQGSKEAKKWLSRDEDINYNKLSTDLAKKIAIEIRTQEPGIWWRKSYGPDKRK